MASSVPNPNSLRINLNLITSQGSRPKVALKFIQWLLTYGRLLAIIVELIVIGTFLYRFKLDSELANVQTGINLQVQYIQAHTPQEASIRQTQLKLATTATTFTQNNLWSAVFPKIAAQEPQGVTLESINVTSIPSSTSLGFQINGTSNNNASLAIFISGLKGEKTFKNITLSNISFDSGIISFTITGDST